MQGTSGGSEANSIATWNLVGPGDEVVMMVPNFMQASGIGRAFGAVVKEWPLVSDPGFRLVRAARVASRCWPALAPVSRAALWAASAGASAWRTTGRGLAGSGWASP